jgi:hypothetical protein
MTGVQIDRKNMPCEQCLAIRCSDIERGHLILREAERLAVMYVVPEQRIKLVRI